MPSDQDTFDGRPAVTVTIVAAVASNGVIGRDGGMPWHLPEDLRHFKRLTLGHGLVMGRRTYESIGRPLPGRTTVVITRQQGWSAPGVTVARTIDEAIGRAAEIHPEVFVAGGSDVYAATLARAHRMVLTEVERAPAGDRSFPEVDWPDWVEVDRIPHDGFAIVTYERRVH